MSRLGLITVLVALVLVSIAAPSATAQPGFAAQPQELWEEFPLDSEKSPPPQPEDQGSPAPEPDAKQTAPQTPAPSQADRAADETGGNGLSLWLLPPLGLLAFIGGVVAAKAALGFNQRRRRAARGRAAPAGKPATQPDQPLRAKPPAPVVAEKPAPVKQKPPAVKQDKPAPVVAQKPAPVKQEKPAPPFTEKPAPAEEKKPPPILAEQLSTPSAPAETPEPKPEEAEAAPPKRNRDLPDDVIPFPTRAGRIGKRSGPPTPQRALGYVSAIEGSQVSDLDAQTEEIRAACVRNGFESVEVVRDFESHSGSDLERPGLTYAIERLEAGEANCLVVASLERLTRSAAHLGTLIDRLGESRIRLVVLDIQLDTGNPDGRLAAEALANVGTLERKSLDTRTRKGLQAARDGRKSSGRPAVADRPALKERIAEMRVRGMTLQAIADTLNAEGVPTLRGGSEWRPSSVQAAVGYKRPKRGARKPGNGNAGGSSEAKRSSVSGGSSPAEDR